MNHWHAEFTTAAKSRAQRFLAVFRITPEGRKPLTLKGGAKGRVTVGGWSVSAELDASKPASLSVTDRRGNAVLYNTPASETAAAPSSAAGASPPASWSMSYRLRCADAASEPAAGRFSRPAAAFPGPKIGPEVRIFRKKRIFSLPSLYDMLKLKPTLLLFALLSVFSGRAFAAAIEFRTLSVNEGLSQSTVLAIAQDGMGRIWMGTQDG